MLFNSFQFIFLFLPITLLGFYLISGRGYQLIAVSWLVAASLFFYGWWNPAYLCLILGSMLFNYAVGVLLGRCQNSLVLFSGVAANLALLAYFKYANFFVDNLNTLVGRGFHLDNIILPLAISFFTFQQIAYLVDVYRNQTHDHRFLHYALFVTFFPQLIAGPIVRHDEILPQFIKGELHRFKSEHLAIGITIFAIGLFKKVLLADGLAEYSSPVFDAAETGVSLSFFEAWGGVLAYTLQIYFDFSGYSDMAIGVARMFGIHLPLNFNSPYKATNIIDFWRCWHMTLSRFLRDYLYIPLCGNRKGAVRRNINILITMLLGGLWHGAGWTFVLWGGLHGVYLLINHTWRKFFRPPASFLGRLLCRTLTVLAVIVAWVPFRAANLECAWHILKAMLGLNGFSIPNEYLIGLNKIPELESVMFAWGVKFESLKYFDVYEPIVLLLLSLVVFILPNSQQIVSAVSKASNLFVWRFDVLWLASTWAMLTLSLIKMGLFDTQNNFIYFQF